MISRWMHIRALSLLRVGRTPRPPPTSQSIFSRRRYAQKGAPGLQRRCIGGATCQAPIAGAPPDLALLHPHTPLPIDLLISLFHGLHTTCGMPWWLSLAAGTAALRCAFTLPLVVKQHRMAQKLLALQPAIKLLHERLPKSLALEYRKKGLSYEEYKADLQAEVPSTHFLSL